MTYRYQTKGTCSREILLSIDDQGKIEDVRFIGGCNGNLSGIGRLVLGRDAKEVSTLLRGTTCGMKNTSCPDQLAIALEKALAQETVTEGK